MRKIIFTSVLISLSAFLFGQDIIIDFNGAGASTNVDVVEVVNLSNCTSIEVPGNSSLNLTTGTIVGINNPINVDEFLVTPYPNPFMGNTTIKFYLPNKDNIEISVNNINGQTVARTSRELYAGIHSYKFTANKAGMYFIAISGGDFKQSAKVMSRGNSLLNTELSYQGNEALNNITKSGNDIYSKDFSFTMGDMLKLKGVSENFATVQTDSPIASKTYIFNFSDCTDYDGNNYAIVEIGNQLWTAENIKAAHYSNGEAIPFIEDDNEWANLGEAHAFLTQRHQATQLHFGSQITGFSSGRWQLEINELFSLLCLETAKVKLTGACQYQLKQKTPMETLCSHGLSNVGHGVVTLQVDEPIFIIYPDRV